MTSRTAESLAARFPGLSSREASDRAAASGANRIDTRTTRSYGRIVAENAFPAANVALMVVAAVLIALGLYVDALLTAGLVVGNIVVSVFQEARAKRQLDRIALLARAPATVIRDGREQQIDPGELVQGDVVVVGPGDQVQADGSVLAADACSVDESLLTGESDLVRKNEGDSVYSGSFCMGGRAAYRCEHVGSESFANTLASQARAFRNNRTPLQREVGYVMWGMAVAVALISIEVVKSFHDIYGRIPLVETTRAAAVIVALVPQGLWVMVTVTYAIAIVRMSPLGTLVQRLNAIESMSHVDVLCLDKTGTITTNQLKVEELHPIGIDEAELRRRLGTYCSSATVSNRTNDAIAKAIGGAAAAVIGEVQFDSVRKWGALTFESGEMRGFYVLGAPEILLARVPSFDATELLRAWSAQGLRVLLFAWHRGPSDAGQRGTEPELPRELEPLGFVILSDELRPGVRTTLAEFAEAGIGVKVISGDNPDTVSALARAAGVAGADRTISGLDLDVTDAARLASAVDETTVFGRIAPAQKSSIVEALQEHGHYVAMIGDGVNDVPALKRSNVAISVRSASPVTRSIADIILMDDSFSALPRAFIEGRRIRAGMEASIRLFLVRTLSIALVIVGAAFLSSEFPLSPRHTAILSTLTVGIPAFVIVLWAKPRFTSRYLFPSSTPFVVPASILTAVMGIVVYEIALQGHDRDTARTALTAAAVLAGVLLIPFVDDPPQFWMRFRGLADAPRTVALAAAMVVLFAIAFAITPLRHVYELRELDVALWLIVVGGVACWTLALAVTWWTITSGRIGGWVSRAVASAEKRAER